MTTIAEKAKALALAGYAVFPVRKDKTPYAADGLKSATLDPFYAEEWFERTAAPHIGVHCGMSGILVLDIDYAEDDNGNVLKDGFDSLDREWLDVKESFSYTSIGGHGKHILYLAPEEANFNGTGRYRGMAGVDRRAGESYIVYNSDEIPDKSSLATAPEWLCDAATLRSVAAFEGTVSDWYESLEPGEPNLLVRRAIEDVEKRFADAGNDFDHAALIESQFRAIRLGSEGNPGVPVLLERIEDLFWAREGDHSRPESEWAHEYAEGLANGIERHGAAIQLRNDLPEYSLASLPAGIPDRLVVGEPGGKEVFRDLLRALQEATDDDLYVTSVLWNCPRTRDISREWGLQFVHERVTSARIKPEPIRENPTLPAPEPRVENVQAEISKTSENGYFLSPEEAEIVKDTKTFIDLYLAASAKKGFSVPAYDIPGAWTALSMAVGPRAITKFNGVGVNLWFIEMGNTGTGKSVSQAFLSGVLDTTLLDGEGNYNLGANSSPAGIHEELLIRDGKASMIHHDEAASFFSDLTNSEWFKSLEHHFSKFYDGIVEPSNKVRLDKNLRGKKASTSFNLNMSATPEKLLKLVTLDMFESGFLSRVNWTWAAPRAENSERYTMAPSEIDAKVKTHPSVYGLAADLASVSIATSPGTIVDGTVGAWARLSEANEQFHAYAKTRERYDILQGPLTRLSETMVKCAALLALYRGENVFTLHDVLVAIRYCVEWLNQFVLVVSQASESAFSRDANEIEVYIKAEGGSVSEAKLMNRFRAMVRNSPKELSDRVDFLRMSGRINRIEADRKVTYVLNG